LQLDCDYQVRVHSPFRAMHLAIEHVLSSFAAHAPGAARLIVKLHPLDSGLVDWTALTGHLAVELGIADRLIVLDGGDLGKVLARKPAVVTVNSTVGSLALACGLPVIALGKAVYDIAGLTFPGELHEFWAAPTPPDAALFDAFRRVLPPAALFQVHFQRHRADHRCRCRGQRLEAAYARPARRYAPQPAAVPVGAGEPIAAATSMR
jgi:capsular polysaccharide export protein